MAERFFTLLGTGNTQTAFQSLGEAHSRDQLRLSSTIVGTNKVLARSGPVIGFEQTKTALLGTRLIRLEYFLYQQDDLSRWHLFFYRNADEKWVLVNIQATTNHMNF